MPYKAALIAFLAPIFTSLAAAQCMLENMVDPNAPLAVMNDPNICLGQGEGAWTFAMASQMACVPAPSPDPANNLAGCATGQGFYILDNACNIRGAYAQPSCGVPYTAMENFLPYVLTVDIVRFGIGQGYFSFYYGDGHYTINNNGCACISFGDGLAANNECKCAFPINGVFSAIQRRDTINGTDVAPLDKPSGVFTTFQA